MHARYHGANLYALTRVAVLAGFDARDPHGLVLGGSNDQRAAGIEDDGSHLIGMAACSRTLWSALIWREDGRIKQAERDARRMGRVAGKSAGDPSLSHCLVIPADNFCAAFDPQHDDAVLRMAQHKVHLHHQSEAHRQPVNPSQRVIHPYFWAAVGSGIRPGWRQHACSHSASRSLEVDQLLVAARVRAHDLSPTSPNSRISRPTMIIIQVRSYTIVHGLIYGTNLVRFTHRYGR